MLECTALWYEMDISNTTTKALYSDALPTELGIQMPSHSNEFERRGREGVLESIQYTIAPAERGH